MMGLLIFNFFSNDVTVEIKAPETVQAGTDFTIEIVFNKGKATGLARFQQDLPEGVTAVTDNNSQLSNADFKFQYQKLRLMWLLLPADEVITVKYTIHVDPSFKGKLKLGGQFNYLKENQRIPVDAKEVVVNVTAGSGVVADSTHNKQPDQTNNTGVEFMLPSDKHITCIRQKPYKNEAGDALIVNISVDQDFGNKYAKIDEDIPSGYIAEAIDTKGGIFTFKDKKVKILWMNLPAESNFSVSYKLKPEDKYVTLGDVNIKGSFSLLDIEKTYNVPVKQEGSSSDVAENKDPNKDIKKEDKKLDPKEQKKQEELKKQEEKKEAQRKKDEDKKEAQRKKDEEKKEAQKLKEEKRQEEKQRQKELAEQKKQDKLNKGNRVTNPEKGVVYKVQVGAGHQQINASYYFRRLKVKDRISLEHHEGWRKYTVGAFPQYKSARDYRVYIWDSTPISDAFVSAYNDGNRITVQEALMIANQKWMK